LQQTRDGYTSRLQLIRI